MSKHQLQYPRQLSFISDLVSCDVCKNTKARTIHSIMVPNTFLGWTVCDEEKCKYVVYLWREEVSIRENVLRDMYGENVKIRRSSGNIEDDWKIYGRAYKLNPKDTWWITVKDAKGKNVKSVSIEDMNSWNEQPV